MHCISKTLLTNSSETIYSIHQFQNILSLNKFPLQWQTLNSIKYLLSLQEFKFLNNKKCCLLSLLLWPSSSANSYLSYLHFLHVSSLHLTQRICHTFALIDSYGNSQIQNSSIIGDYIMGSRQVICIDCFKSIMSSPVFKWLSSLRNLNLHWRIEFLYKYTSCQ